MHKLSSDTVRYVCSGQVITSPSCVVKELVENAVDANATIIDIRLEEFGLAKIEVRDNGRGVPVDCRHAMALPHYTSKIVEFHDLNDVKTYGFRGEALTSINTVGTLTVTTRTSSDYMAASYEFDKCGEIKSTKTSPLQIGTTVLVTKLFQDLPVRKQFFKGKKGKEQVGITEHFLKGMAIAQPTIRFMLRHNQKLLWQHAKSDELKSAIASAYTSVADMLPFGFEEGNTKVEGMLSVTTFSKDHPFVIINSRVVKCKTLIKCIKALYNGYLPKGAIRVTLDPKCVDVNVEVNKSNLIFQNETDLFNKIEQCIKKDVLSSLQGDGCAVLTEKPQPEIPNVTANDCKNPATSKTKLSETTGTNKHFLTLEQEEENPSPFRLKPVESVYKMDTSNDDIDLLELSTICKPENTRNNNMHIFTNFRKEKTEEIWSDLENELLDKETPQKKLTNIIYDDHEDLPTPSQCQMKQTSITLFSPTASCSMTSNSANVTAEFSPCAPASRPENPRPIQQKRIQIDNTQPTITSFSHNVSPEVSSPFSIIGNKQASTVLTYPKKREKSVSPKITEKRRKIDSPVKNKMIFTMPKSSTDSESIISRSAPATLKINDKWFVIWNNTLYIFNPHRAQEVNIMTKLKSFYTLKTGPSLVPEIPLNISEVGAKIFTSLIKSETYFDNMGSFEYIKNKMLTLNGIKIKKINDGHFVIVNVTEEIEEFTKDDVIETVRNIFDDESENHRCKKILRYFEGKAKILGHAKFSDGDVLDLFSNTKTNKCCHGQTFVKSIWDLELSQSSQHFGELSFEEQLSE